MFLFIYFKSKYVFTITGTKCASENECQLMERNDL